MQAFQRRSLKKKYRFLILDGVVLKRRNGTEAIKRVLLVALRILLERKKDFGGTSSLISLLRDSTVLGRIRVGMC